MAVVIQTILDGARLTLKDAAKREHSDANLLKWYNDCIKWFFANRPDYFIVIGLTTAPTDYAAASNHPLPDETAPQFESYIVARAESVNDDAVNDGSAAKHMKEFRESALGN